MDDSPQGSSVHGILQARILEWVAFPFSGDLPNLGIEPRSPALLADSLLSEPLTRHQSCQCYDLRLPRLQNDEKCLLVKSQPVYGIFVIAVQID